MTELDALWIQNFTGKYVVGMKLCMLPIINKASITRKSVTKIKKHSQRKPSGWLEMAA